MNPPARTFREFTPETAYDYLLYRLRIDLFIESSHVPKSRNRILFASEINYYNIDQVMCIAEEIWQQRRHEEIKSCPARAKRIFQLQDEWSALAGEPVTVEFIDAHFFGTATREGIMRLAQAIQRKGPTTTTQNAFYGWADLFQVWYLKIDE